MYEVSFYMVWIVPGYSVDEYSGYPDKLGAAFVKLEGPSFENDMFSPGGTNGCVD